MTNPAQVMLNIARKLGDRSFALKAQSCPSLCHTLYSGTRTHLGPPLGPWLTAKSRSTRARARSDAHTLRYITYEPWLVGVYAEYTTLGLGQRKFAAEINPERSEGFIEAANFLWPRPRVVYSAYTPPSHGLYITYFLFRSKTPPVR